MKFGKQLEQTVNENHPAWKKYAVDYKGMKKSLPSKHVFLHEHQHDDSDGDDDDDHSDAHVVSRTDTKATTTTTTISHDDENDYTSFWEIFERSQEGLGTFYQYQDEWAQMKQATLQEDFLKYQKQQCSQTSVEGLLQHLYDFRRQVECVADFLQVNQMAFCKILKKYDKRTFSQVRDTKMAELLETEMYLHNNSNSAMSEYLAQIDSMIQQLEEYYHSRSSTSSSGKKRSHETRDAAASLTHRILRHLEEKSPFLAKYPSRVLPIFDITELKVGSLLGRGQFASVHEIQSFSLAPPSSSEEEADPVKWAIMQQEQQQQQQQPSSDKSSTRYVIKQVNESSSKSHMVDGTVDLAVEAKFLSCLSHPNIINLVGVGGISRSGFLILDRLHDTLYNKIYHIWKPQQESCDDFYSKNSTTASSLLRLVQTNDQKKKRLEKHQDYHQLAAMLWKERLQAMYDVAKGIQYLHDHELVHRDLKPDNIGFDEHGTAKIFDFGLIKELMPVEKVADDQFKASGRTGTRKYMAPEVVLCKPYGKPIDVYSFAMVLWETMSLETPFEGYGALKLSKAVLEKHARPPFPSRQLKRQKRRRSWPKALKSFLSQAWDKDPSLRPTAHQVCSVLQELLLLEEDIFFNKK